MAWECCKLLLVYFDIKNRTMATTVILAVNEKTKTTTKKFSSN